MPYDIRRDFFDPLESMLSDLEQYTSKSKDDSASTNSASHAIAVLDKFESTYNLSAEAKITVDLVRQFARQQQA